MKKLFVSLMAAALIVSCDHDDTPADVTGSVSFVVNGSGLGAGRTSGLVPEKVVVSVEDKDGKTIIDSKIFNLSTSNDGYSTEKIKFDQGEYKVTKYLVISGTTAAYATPRSGAQKSGLIDKPLPFDFSVLGSQHNEVTPKIIGISSQDTPENFGYNDFGYNVPDAPVQDYLVIRVKLEMTLGGVYYPNIDGDFTVRAFDEANNVTWQQNFVYTGPETNDLRIKDGFHHYTIEARKWGKVMSQIYTRASLYDGRVREGVVPSTQVFQAQVEPKKLAGFVTSTSREVPGGTTMEPSTKTTYEYKDGRIDVVNSFVWSRTEKRFIEDTRAVFSYEGNRVKKITTYLVSQESAYSEDNYTYDADGYVSHIQHKGFGDGITTEVDLTHQFGDRLVKVSYRLSNGAGFDYEFVNQYGSLKSDKTTRGSQLCSEGTYSFDKNINPMRHLGYVDYLMRNYSISNKLTESVNYVGCSFPSFIPESYEYAYDIDGYPLRATTNYRSSALKTEIEYTYVE